MVPAIWYSTLDKQDLVVDQADGFPEEAMKKEGTFMEGFRKVLVLFFSSDEACTWSSSQIKHLVPDK